MTEKRLHGRIEIRPSERKMKIRWKKLICMVVCAVFIFTCGFGVGTVAGGKVYGAFNEVQIVNAEPIEWFLMSGASKIFNAISVTF